LSSKIKNTFSLLALALFITGCTTLGRSESYRVKIQDRQGQFIPGAEAYVQFKKQHFMRVAETENPQPLKIRADGTIKVPSKLLLDKKAWGTWLLQVHVGAPGFKTKTVVVAKYENSSTTTNPEWVYPVLGRSIVLDRE